VLEIREATEADREEIALVDGLAFNYQADPADVTVSGALCACYRGRVVGSGYAIPMHQWFGGARVRCAGVASVVVLPEFRGRGMARNLMAELLARQRGAGDAVSVLYPANASLYRQLGYEFAGLRPQFRAAMGDFPTGPKTGEGTVREMGEDDLPSLMACFSRFASRHSGPVEPAEPARWTDHVLAHKGEGMHQRTVVVPGDQGIDGYASYFLEARGENGYPLTCKHLVALTPSALLPLLSYFRHFENSAKEVAWFGPPSGAPVALALSSTAFSLESRTWRWMGRVLDVPKALEGRGYPIHASGEVVVRIEDPLFPDNDGPWRLEVASGKCAVTRADALTAPESDDSLPVGLFSALYTGFVQTSDLIAMGALGAGDERLSSLSAFFGGTVPWMPDFF